jgi:germination protein, Ger(x)C family
MKRMVLCILSLLLLSGCWDRLPLRDLQMIDAVAFDRNEETKDIAVDLIVTSLKRAGMGEGEPIAEQTELEGKSVIEAVGKSEYMDQGPFSAVNTRVFLMSERFASDRPVKELEFLLHAPYTSINTPVVIFKGEINDLIKYKVSNRKAPIEKLNTFIRSLDANGLIQNVSMMEFLTSQRDSLDDYPMPVVNYADTKFELESAMLYHAGLYTGGRLTREQLRMLMFMIGVDQGKQRITGRLSESSGVQNLTYGFSVKSVHNRYHAQQDSGRLPKMTIDVRLNISVFDIGENIETLKPTYSHKMQQLLITQFNREANVTIQALQKANCDALGIGKHLRAYHPKLWKSLDWRNDYPNMKIEPRFNIHILNTDGFEEISMKEEQADNYAAPLFSARNIG